MIKKKRVNKINSRILQKKALKGNLIYANFLIGLDYLKKIKNYVWFSTGLFFLISIFGYLFPIFFTESIRKLIEELVKQTQGLDLFGLIRFIMVNNIQSALIGAVLGVFLAIIPLGIIIVNGYILGFVANKSVSSEGFLILWRLIPHGIFEIPAIMISVALGIRLGLFLFIYHGRDRKKEFLKWVLNSVRVFMLIVVPLLVVAGIIEGLLIWMIG